MGFFKKKKPSEKDASIEQKSLQEIVHERILTAEGWRRRMLKKAKKLASK